jgi:hypothetical protein
MVHKNNCESTVLCEYWSLRLLNDIDENVFSKFSILVNKLLDRKVPPIVATTLIGVYEDQYGWVKWGGARSIMFTIRNGTRQGFILSPSLFAVYVDELLQELRSLGVGCYVADMYCGAVGFCCWLPPEMACR